MHLRWSVARHVCLITDNSGHVTCEASDRRKQHLAFVV
jgi:hypothetical protein